MTWIVAGMKWIMLVSGALTCTMIYVAIAPQAALRAMFGESIEGPVAEIVVRNWGGLIALIGGMLIAGGFNPAVRFLVLTAASLSKVGFITLVLVYGRQFLGGQVGTAVVIDVIQIAVFVACMIAARRMPMSTISPESAQVI